MILQRKFLSFISFIAVFSITHYLPATATTNSLKIAQQLDESSVIALRKATQLSQEGLNLFQQNTVKSRQQARQKFQEALVIFRQQNHQQGQMLCLATIGKIYGDFGDTQRAIEYYNQALPLAEATGERGWKGNILNNLGLIYSQLGEKQTALEYYHQALPVYRQVKDKDGEGTTLSNFGLLYADLGDKERAITYYNQALPLFKAINKQTSVAVVLNNLGQAYSDLADFNKALEYFRQSLSLRRQVEDRVGEGTVLLNIGAIYLEQRQPQEALKSFETALPLFRQGGRKREEANILVGMGRVFDELKQPEKALNFYRQALPLYRSVGDRSGEATTLNNIGFVERDRGNLQAAIQNVEKAIAIIEDLRTKINHEDLRTSYFATQQHTYNLYIDLLMRLHQQQPQRGYDALALHISERSRARSLIELLAQANVRLTKNIPPSLLAQEKSLQNQRQIQEKLLGEYQNQPQPDPEIIKATENKINEIIQQQKALQTQINQQNPERRELTNPQTILKLPEIQKQLDQDTVLLQYSLGKNRSYLWLVTTNSLTSYELPKAEEIENIAQQFHTQLSQATTANDLAMGTGKKLSDIILAPVADKLAGKRLIIVADGILQNIPFATLPDPRNRSSEYQPLMLNHEIAKLPSASTIAIKRRQLAQRRPAPKAIAIIADPVYNHNDERLTGKPGNNPLAPELELERTALQRSAKTLNRNGWDRLPGTQQEAKAILNMVPGDQTLSAFGFDANYNLATSKNLNQYRILHFATHGFVNEQQPELSGIVLSLLDPQGNQIPGYLRLGDLFNQDYPAELIVLSACETGLGKNVSGEGLVGLTRGLMYAGAARVLVSSWQVSDAGTAVLMEEFYRQMFKEKKTPTQALQIAQRRLWENPQWRSPFYWGAFSLQGEWR
ncbi:TPR domain protein [Calothrix sp. NIES-3974]|nr:TPR domain protein [Calothrix sp. NIES-3974]